MKTRRLYFEDPYLQAFTAEITGVKAVQEGFAVSLDRSAFYPEGGGQPSDTGYIGSARVLHAAEEGDRLLHITDTDPGSGRVNCTVDWDRRFDHMQQHTGQHILSACFAKLMNGDTNSFHLGKDIVSIEINIDGFSDERCREIEDMANGMVFDCLPVSARFVSETELSALPLRKKPKVSENIRIVEIRDMDYSPCGGTHVENTGEVGLIRIVGWEKLKDCCRFTFVCGYRALRDYRLKSGIAKELGEKLSVRDFEITDAFGKLQTEYKAMQKQLAAVKQALCGYEAAELLKEAREAGAVRLIARYFRDKSSNELKSIAQSITQQPGHIALLACGSETVQFIFSRSDDVGADMNALFKAVSPIINGKGGGSSKTAQGGGSRPEAVEEFLAAAASVIGNR